MKNAIPGPQVVMVQPLKPMTPTDEVQYVADYQEGWNDAQAKRPHKCDASIYYRAGFVDGAYAGTWQ